MKPDNFDLSKLPHVNFKQLDKLPTHSAIYFVVDSQNRMLYVGQSKNLLDRWKSHHRLHQLREIDRETPIRIFWLVWTESDLSQAENHFIELYQPLLNRTKIKSAETIPSEIILQELLKEIRLLIVVVGIKQARTNELSTVFLRYDYESSGIKGCAKTIKRFKQENKDRGSNLRIKRSKYGEYRTHNLRPGSREHRKVSRIKSSYNNHWEIFCNGVIIDITPIDRRDFKLLRNKENSRWMKLADIKIRAVKNLDIYDEYARPLVSLKQYIGLSFVETDPIPLFWT